MTPNEADLAAARWAQQEAQYKQNRGVLGKGKKMVGSMGEGLQKMVGKDKKKTIYLDDGYQALQTEDPMAHHMNGVQNGVDPGPQDPYNPMAANSFNEEVTKVYGRPC